MLSVTPAIFHGMEQSIVVLSSVFKIAVIILLQVEQLYVATLILDTHHSKRLYSFENWWYMYEYRHMDTVTWILTHEILPHH